MFTIYFVRVVTQLHTATASFKLSLVGGFASGSFQTFQRVLVLPDAAGVILGPRDNGVSLVVEGA